MNASESFLISCLSSYAVCKTLEMSGYVNETTETIKLLSTFAIIVMFICALLLKLVDNFQTKRGKSD